MKKLFLTLGLAAFLMTSCCDKQENKENCEQKECCKDKKEQCDKHHECDHHGEKPEMCPKMMACMDQMIEALANWEDLDEAQRAELIDMAKKVVAHKEAMKAECEKEGEHKCCKEGKPECCKEGEKKCEGNHEGCQKHEGKCEHQHEGCQHEEK